MHETLRKIDTYVSTRDWLAPIGLLVLLLFLVGSALLIYRNVSALNESAEWVSHTREVLTATEGMLSDMNEADASTRGFLLTGDDSFQERAKATATAALARLDALQRLVEDNPRQVPRLSLLDRILQEKFALGHRLRENRDGDTRLDRESMALLVDASELSLRIKEVVHEVERSEHELLEIRQDSMQLRRRQTMVTLLAFTLIGSALSGVLYWLLRRHWRLQRLARAQTARFDRELGEMARYNERLLISTGEGIYGIDPNGRCTFINRSAAVMLGGEAEDFMGKDMHELVHHSHADGQPFPAVDCPIYQAVRSGDGCRKDDEVFWTLDNRPFPVDYSSFPIFAEEDPARIEGAVITFNNISASVRARKELHEAVEAAEAANQSKSQFLANMSHELRTPLNAVMMYSELLIEEAEDQEVNEFIPDLKKIRGAGRHLLELVNSLLDLSKIEAGKMELFPEELSIPDVLRDIATTMQPMMEKNGNELRVDVADDCKTMVADVTKVRQILLNLLSNAAKFTENGDVTLNASVVENGDQRNIVFQVSDTGIGMSAEVESRLFLPFSQADASTTRKYGGTGLGLAIIQRFTELMQGSVGVESVEGKGSTFTVTLPERAEAPVVQPRTTLRDDDAATPAHREKLEKLSGKDIPIVLVIDDDPAIREVLTRALIAENIRPLTASNGAEGIQRCRETHPDLIILDVLMPKVDGWSVLAALKADDNLADIPVVVHSIREDRELGFMLGASEYLVKPVDRRRLLAVLHRHLNTADDLVLVVDDDEPTSRLISRVIKRQGWRAVEAGNGFEALEELARETPSAILLDLMMPQMDGFTFLEHLHANKLWQDIPVVILTARDLTAEERERLNGSVLRIVEKSGVNRDRLLDEVRRTLEKALHVSAEKHSSADGARTTIN